MNQCYLFGQQIHEFDFEGLRKTKVQARTGIHGSWSSLMAGGGPTMCQKGSAAKSRLETVGGVPDNWADFTMVAAGIAPLD